MFCKFKKRKPDQLTQAKILCHNNCQAIIMLADKTCGYYHYFNEEQKDFIKLLDSIREAAELVDEIVKK